MTEDIEIARIGMEQNSTTEEDETEPPSQSTEETSLFRRIGWHLVRFGVIFALLLVSLAVYHSTIEGDAAFLGLFGGLWSLFSFGRSEGAEDSGGESNAESDGMETDGGAVMADTDATEQSRTTRIRDQPEIFLTDLPEEVSTEQIVDVLMRRGEEEPLPDASAIIARIQRPLAATLEGVPTELDILRRDIGPVLIGVADNEKTVDKLSDTFGLMLIVSPKHEDHLDRLMKYVPALIQTDGISGLGSARTFSVPAPKEPGTGPKSQDTIKNLRLNKGNPRHPIARPEPDFIAAAAPPGWSRQVEKILSDYAPVIEVIEWDQSEIHVAGFIFNSTIELPDHIVNPDDTITPGSGDRSNSDSQRNGTTTSHSSSGSGSGNESRPAEPDGGAKPRDASSPDTSTTTVTPSENAGGFRPDDEADQASDDQSTDSDTDARDHDAEETAPSSDSRNDDTGPGPDTDNVAGSDEPPRSDTSGDGSDGPSHPDRSNSSTNRATPQNSESEDGQDRLVPDSNVGGNPEMRPDEESSSPANGSGSSSSNGQRTRPSENSSDSDDSPVDSRGREQDDSAPSRFNRAPEDSKETDDMDSPRAPDASDEGYRRSSAGSDVSGDNGPDNGAGAPSQSGDESSGSENGLTPAQLPPPTPHRSSSRAGRPARPDTSAETPPPGEATAPESAPMSSTPETPTSEPPGSSHSDSTSSTGPPFDIDTGPGIVPDGEASASSDPMIVDVDEHVLNELTYQATATPNREVYSTIYADEDGVIRHWHPVEHPDFLETRRNSINFTANFFKHLRNLSRLRKEDIDHRLAGGAHSHPNTGQPRQSPADKRFARKVWRNQRNTMFIIGINEGDGPDEWTISDNSVS